MTHSLDVRVYYEDTDLAGIVYYANYLKFMERGRTEMLRSLGIDQAAFKEETGAVFAVRSVNITYRRPAKFGDLVTVETSVTAMTGATVDLLQRVQLDGETLTEADVRIVQLSAKGRPMRLGTTLRARLASLG